MMHTKKDDSLNCFGYKMFSKSGREGLKDWENVNHLLKIHEDSQEHNANMAQWKDMGVCLAKGLTVDRKEMALFDVVRKR